MEPRPRHSSTAHVLSDTRPNRVGASDPEAPLTESQNINDLFSELGSLVSCIFAYGPLYTLRVLSFHMVTYVAMRQRASFLRVVFTE